MTVLAEFSGGTLDGRRFRIEHPLDVYNNLPHDQFAEVICDGKDVELAVEQYRHTGDLRRGKWQEDIRMYELQEAPCQS